MTNREDLYQQAEDLWAQSRGFGRTFLTERAVRDLRAVVDLALDARPELQPWEVLREADKLIRGHWNFDGIDSTRLLALAKDLEAEHQAAQEKAAAEAEREKLIERAARIMWEVGHDLPWDDATEISADYYRSNARVLADAGFLSAPTTDGGEA